MNTRSYVSSRARALRSARERVSAPHLGLALVQPESLQIRPQRRQRAASRSTNTARCGAPRQRLDPQRAGAREQVEHRRALRRRRASRTAPPAPARRWAAWPCPSAPSAACRRSARRSPACQAPGHRRSAAHAGIGSSACRRTPLERVAEQRVLGRLELGVRRDDRLRPRPRALEQRASSGRHATSNWLEPGLAGPHQLALLAQLEVDLRQAKAVGVLHQRAQPRAGAGSVPPASSWSGARRARPARAAGAAGRSRSARRSPPASPSRWARRCQPRSRSWPPARRPCPTRTPPSPRCFSRGRICPCSSTSRYPSSSPAAQTLELGGRRTQAVVWPCPPLARGAASACLGLLDQRADHVCLPARARSCSRSSS